MFYRQQRNKTGKECYSSRYLSWMIVG